MDTWMQVLVGGVIAGFTLVFALISVVWKWTKEEMRILRQRSHDISDRVAALEGQRLLEQWQDKNGY